MRAPRWAAVAAVVLAMAGCASKGTRPEIDLGSGVPGRIHKSVTVYRNVDIAPVEYAMVVLHKSSISPEPAPNLYLSASKIEKITRRIDGKVAEELSDVFSVAGSRASPEGDYLVAVPYMVAGEPGRAGGTNDDGLFSAALQAGSDSGDRLSLEMDVYDGRSGRLIARYVRGLSFDGAMTNPKEFKRDASESIADIVDEMACLAGRKSGNK